VIGADVVDVVNVVDGGDVVDGAGAMVVVIATDVVVA